MAVKRVTEQLQRLGMSGYEAKAYIALLSSDHPLNGYEVAKRSGVPRSTVYETLAKLVDRGAAYEVHDPDKRNGHNTTTYVPLPHEHLLDRMTRHFEESVSELRAALPSLTVLSDEVHLIHNLTGRDSILTRAGDVISQAKRDLFVSAWPQELEPLLPHLHAAENRRAEVSVMAFGQIEDKVGHFFDHKYSSPEVVFENLGCRLFVVVSDREEALIGGFLDDEAWGAYTNNPAVVLVAVEYIRHDIAMNVIVDRLPSEEAEEYWTNEPELNRLRSDKGAPARLLRQQLASSGPTDRQSSASPRAQKE